MIYLRQPSEFSPLTNTVCELPIDCFEDLVTGAVELFFNYRYKVTLANSSARAAAKERARQQADTKDKENDND